MGFYSSLEDKWYALLDKINAKVPVYKVIDPIDRVIPSLVLFIAAIIALAGLGILFLFPSEIQPLEAIATFKVVDQADSPLRGIELRLEIDGQETVKETGKNGTATVYAKPGTKISLEIRGTENFEGFKKEYAVLEDHEFEVRLRLIKPQSTQVLLQFKDSGDSRLIKGKSITVYVSCSSGKELDEPVLRDTDYDGKILAEVPEGCGTLVVEKAEIAGYESFNSRTVVNGNPKDILLKPLNGNDPDLSGKLYIEAEDFEGAALQGMLVEVFKYGTKIGEGWTDSIGTAVFGLDPGEYDVVVSDPDLEYVQKEVKGIYLGARDEKSKRIVLEKAFVPPEGGDGTGGEPADGPPEGHESVAGILKITVLDIDSGERVINALVLLKGAESGKNLGTKNTRNTGRDVEFVVPEEELELSVSAECFYPFMENIFFSDGNRVVELERIPDCPPAPDEPFVPVRHKKGVIVVEAREKESGEGVQGTKIWLKYEDGRTVESGRISGNHPEDTNADGVAVFEAVESGNYYAYAEKGFYRGESAVKSVQEDSIVAYLVKMEMDNANVNIRVENEFGETIKGAKIEAVFKSGEKETHTLPEGKIALSLPAGKSIYVKATHKDYETGISKEYYLKPNYTHNINIKLELKKVPGQKLGLEKGIKFYSGENRVNSLRAGEKYRAVLKLRIPENSGYRKAGVHFRTGDSERVENDNLLITGYSAGGRNFSVMGSSYHPPDGEALDLALDNLTNSNAKWVNITWIPAEAGEYEIAVEFRIKEGLEAGDKISFHYRAWGEKENKALDREPEDEGIAGKQPLYALTFDEEFEVRAPQGGEGGGDEPEIPVDGPAAEPVCSPDRQEGVCVTFEGLKDLNEEPYIFTEDNFNATVNGEYEYRFEVLNDGEKVYENAKIYVSNSSKTGKELNALEFLEYTLTNASGRTIKSSLNPINETNKLPRIELGNFSKGKKITGTLKFKALLPSGNVPIALKIFELTDMGAEERFGHYAEIDVDSMQEMEVQVEPAQIFSFTRPGIRVTVLDEDGFPVRFANVYVDKEIDGYRSALMGQRGELETDNYGKAVFTLTQEMRPGARLYFTTRKFGFEPAETLIRVDANILDVSPKTLSFSLEKFGKKSHRENIELFNQINRNLTIKEIEFIGKKFPRSYLGYYLDLQGMNRFIEASGFIGKLIPKKSLADPPIQFYAAINQGLPEEETGSVNGVYNIVVTDGTFDWSFDVGFNANIGTGAELENNDCLGIDGASWEELIEESETITHNFYITNGCLEKNTHTPLALRNLSARIRWTSGTPNGTIQLKIENGKSLTNELQEMRPAYFFNSVEADAEYVGTLIFTPEQDTKEAHFEVTVQAEALTDSGLSTVYSNALTANLGAINLRECLKIGEGFNNPVKVDSGEHYDSFSVVNECKTRVDVIFCHNDPGCRGGTTEGGISLSPQIGRFGAPQITLSKDGSAEVTVSRGTVPGIYGVKVEARTEKNPFWVELGTLDVLVDPEDKEPFSLVNPNNYEYVLLKGESKDAVTLVNSDVFTTVNVKASVCAWDEARKKNTGKLAKWTAAHAGVVAAGNVAAAYSVAVAGFAAKAFGAIGLGFCVGPWGIACIGASFIPEIIAWLSDPCKETETNELGDYTINLSGRGIGGDGIPRDWNGLSLSEHGKNVLDVEPNWDETLPEISETPGEETVGLIFRNISLGQKEPAYDVLTVKARRHIHADPTSYGKNPDAKFSMFDVKDLGLLQVTQKFHLRFITRVEEQKLPELEQNQFACASGDGTIKGRTGEGITPKIKLDWGFEDKAIAWNECDSGNEEAIYCDATQFSIMMWKRIAKLNDFMKENGYDFACPDLPGESEAAKQNAEAKSHSVPEEKIGISEIGNSLGESGDALLSATVKNNTGEAQDVNVLFRLNVPEEAEYLYNGETECEKKLTGIGKNGATASASCRFEELPESETPYTGSIQLEHLTAEGDKQDDKYFEFSLMNNSSSASLNCWIEPSTVFFNDLEPLNVYLNALDPTLGELVNQESVKFGGQSVSTDSEKIKQVLQEMHDLMHFKAYLIRDGYSADFQKDFVKYYSTSTFFQVPSLELDDAVGTEAMQEIGAYYNDRTRFSFRNRYFDEYELPDAGLYAVDIGIDYADDWALFTADGNPKATVSVEFQRLQKPSPNSIFYYLPFNGRLGYLDEDRIGYGTAYTGEEVQLSKTRDIVSTEPLTRQPAEMASVELETATEKDLAYLNSETDTRGKLLAISGAGNKKRMVFSPSLATPVIMKVQGTKSEKPLTAAYHVEETGKGKSAGDNLTYWKGLGQCYDFGGLPAQRAIVYKADSRATSKDTLNFQYAYKTVWEPVSLPGTEYLGTILYTPTETNMELKAQKPASLKFFSPDTAINDFMVLNGLQGMELNQQNHGIEALEQLFELVEEGKVCMEDTATEAGFYWNETALLNYAPAGKKSLNQFELGLGEGSCITTGN